MNSLKQTIRKSGVYIIGVVVVAGAFFAYHAWYVQPKQEDLGVGSLSSENQLVTQSQLGRDILSTLNQLKTISIDPEFFLENRFQQLVDFSIAIEAQPVGTANPFEETSLFVSPTQPDTVAEVLGDTQDVQGGAD